MPPLLLVGIVLLTSQCICDVTLRDSSAYVPAEAQEINYNLASPRAPQNFWWMSQPSPLKDAYDYYKKCAAKGNCVSSTGLDGSPTVILKSPQPFRPQPNPISHGPTPPAESSRIDINRNPFLNGQFQGVTDLPPKNNEGSIDLSKNPFLSGVVTTGNGAPISKDQEFLGVQPVPPFNNGGQKKPFATTHPLENKKPFSKSHPNEKKDGSECHGINRICVEKQLCINGVVNNNGEGLLQVRSDVQVCDVPREICCSLDIVQSRSSQPRILSLPEITGRLNGLGDIADNGKSSVSGSTVKFQGGLGFSPGSVQVLTDPNIYSFGETKQENTNSAKAVRDVSSSSTADYSNVQISNNVRFGSAFQGPAYLPPVSPLAPSPSSSPNIEVAKPSTFRPSGPTYQTTIITHQSPIPTFKPSTPGPFSTPKPTERPGYTIPVFVNPQPTNNQNKYTPKPSKPISNESLPPTRQTPSKSHISITPRPKLNVTPNLRPQPTIPVAVTAGKDYLPPTSDNNINNQYFGHRPSTNQPRPSVYQLSQTTRNPYQPSRSTSNTYHPSESKPSVYQPSQSTFTPFQSTKSTTNYPTQPTEISYQEQPSQSPSRPFQPAQTTSREYLPPRSSANYPQPSTTKPVNSFFTTPRPQYTPASPSPPQYLPPTGFSTYRPSSQVFTSTPRPQTSEHSFVTPSFQKPTNGLSQYPSPSSQSSIQYKPQTTSGYSYPTPTTSRPSPYEPQYPSPSTRGPPQYQTKPNTGNEYPTYSTFQPTQDNPRPSNTQNYHTPSSSRPTNYQPQTTSRYKYPTPSTFKPSQYPQKSTTIYQYSSGSSQDSAQYQPKPSTGYQYPQPSSPKATQYQSRPTTDYQYPATQETPGYQPNPTHFNPQPTQTVNYFTEKPLPTTPKPSSNIPQVFLPTSSRQPNLHVGYTYPKPTPAFSYPSPSTPSPSIFTTNKQYLPPSSETEEPPSDKDVDETNESGQNVAYPRPPKTTKRPSTPQYFPQSPYYPQSTQKPQYTKQPSYPAPSDTNQNVVPPSACAAALKCVQEIYCTPDGFVSTVPVVLSKEQEINRVPTTTCQDKEAGIIGKCCRDPNYKDPWPSANLVDGFDDGQYKEDDSIAQYNYKGSQQLQRNVRSGKGGPKQNTNDQLQSLSVPQSRPQSLCGARHLGTTPPGVGHLDVNFAEISWQAMILRDSNRSLLCGGAIIRFNAVLTTAHCVEGLNTSDILIKGGEWKLGIDEEPLPFQIVKVSVIARHPGYKHGSLLNDLAILFLEEKLRPAKNIGTICLPKSNEILTQNCIATGWGKRILQLHARGAIMHAININVMDAQQCQETLSSRFQHTLEHYSPNTLCGFSDIDQCRVDYGSALACSDGNNRYTLSGIFAWDTGCREQGQIGGYVAPDVNWIEGCLAKSFKDLKKEERQYVSSRQ